MKAPFPEVLTIGHSTLSYERFLELLRDASVTAIADVRSSPYSRHFPHFNSKTLKDELASDGVAYAFLGAELGGRPKEKHLYSNEIADYEKMALAGNFVEGIERVICGSHKFKIAVMCSEHDPMDCHRCLLVGRALHSRGVGVKHILHDGQLISQREIERKLMEWSKTALPDLFQPIETQLANAYRERARKVAFNAPKASAFAEQ